MRVNVDFMRLAVTSLKVIQNLSTIYGISITVSQPRIKQQHGGNTRAVSIGHIATPDQEGSDTR